MLSHLIKISSSPIVATGASFHEWKFLPTIDKYVFDLLQEKLAPNLAQQWAWDRVQLGAAQGILKPSRDLKDFWTDESGMPGVVTRRYQKIQRTTIDAQGTLPTFDYGHSQYDVRYGTLEACESQIPVDRPLFWKRLQINVTYTQRLRHSSSVVLALSESPIPLAVPSL